MSNNDGILITNKNIYGLVNPPPAPSYKDGALPHQDISSAAVRWDTFVDLSNQGFTFTPANPTFMSIIDKIPYSLGNGIIWYPLYQACQITFTQTQTFSKMRLWLKGRRGLITNQSTLRDELPTKVIIGNSTGTANWAHNKIINPNHPKVIAGLGKTSNRDGMCNTSGRATCPPPGGPVIPFTPLNDSGIAEGVTRDNQPNGKYDVWDCSGPTIQADPTATGKTYEMYRNISPNGWNLAFDVFITETAPNGDMRYYSNKGTWAATNVQSNTGKRFYYNPQAFALVKGTDACAQTMGVSTPSYHVPPLTRDVSTNNIDNVVPDFNWQTVADATWAPSTSGAVDFHVIHSQTTNFVGDHLWYCEQKCGFQFNGDPPPPPPITPPATSGLQAWTDIPITFKKDHSYLANVAMINIQAEISKSTTTTGPGLVNIDALTYLELIV